MRKYKETPLNGFLVLRSNGENKSLTEDEQVRILEVVLEEKAEHQLVMAGAGYESTRQTIAASKRAAELGADFVSLLSPGYFKKSLTDNAGSLNTIGLEFYSPRRPHKYWTSKNAKYNTFTEAVAALAQQYDRSPEWIQHHMGATNDLDEIHRNLANRKQNAPVKIQADDNEEAPEIIFYDPRRPYKYWTSTNA